MNNPNELTPSILAMYLGCEALHEQGIGLLCVAEMNGELAGDNIVPNWSSMRFAIKGLGFAVANIESKNIKPLLRRLDSMTEEEARELLVLINGDAPNARDLIAWGYTGLVNYLHREDERMLTQLQDVLGSPVAWAWLLSKRFDIFGLIDAGLAIDKERNPHLKKNR